MDKRESGSAEALIDRAGGTERALQDHELIVTIDGPAGTGKSTVARALACRLGLDFLDTGAMYRAAAAIVIDKGLSLDDHDAVVAVLEDADLHFDWATDPPAMLAWDRPLDERIRDQDVTGLVSAVSAIAPLRAHMVRKQRLIGRQHPRLVTEGRDQGSVVFTDAAVKFYLDARPEIRAKRRAEQLVARGLSADEGSLLAEILRRDNTDSSRAVGPLRVPAGAVRMDTSDLSFDEVVDELERVVVSRVAL